MQPPDRKKIVFRFAGAAWLALMTLAAEPAQAANLQLRWQNTSASQTGVIIERQSGASYLQIASLSAGAQSYSDTGLSAGTTYCYRVRSFNNNGPSPYSNSACAATAAAPLPPVPPPALVSAPASGATPPKQTPNLAGAWSDYRLSLKMLSRDRQAIGVIFRYQDPENYYRFSWCGAAQCRRLEKQVNGVFVTLAQDSGRYVTGQNYAVDIVAQGARLQVSIDGAVIFSVTDATFATGTIGLYSNNNAGSSFDAVTLTDSAAGTTLLAADFSDGTMRGWTVIDEGADGPPSKWSAANGSLVQKSKIGSTDASALGTFALYTRRPWKDIRARFRIKSDDDDRIGFMFRFQDSNNFYRFVWNKGIPGRRLLKKENGVYTVLAEDAVPYVTGQTYQIEITVQGPTLQAAVDGKTILAASDAGLSTGSIAFYSSFNQGSSYDDLLVEDLIAKTTLLDASFNPPSLAGWTIIDETGTNAGPSVWTIKNGALVQESNIGSDSNGYPGTFLLY